MDPKLRASGPPKTSWTYYGNSVQLPEPIGPQLYPRPNTIEAELVIPDKGAQGVVTCAGAFSAGWSLFVINNKPVFRYNVFEVADLKMEGKTSLPKGNVNLTVQFVPDGSKTGGGNFKMMVNGAVVAEGKMARTAFRHGLEPFEVGRDTGTPVDLAYKNKGEFPFTGTISKVNFRIDGK